MWVWSTHHNTCISQNPTGGKTEPRGGGGGFGVRALLYPTATYMYIFNTTAWINRPTALNESLTCVCVYVCI